MKSSLGWPQSASRFALAALVVLGMFLRVPGMWTPGYFLDEELTYAAAHGIQTHGVPVLPSGVLYDRGLLYSYLAWLSGVVIGQGFVAYRLPSLLAALVMPVVLFRTARVMVGDWPALGVAALIVFSPFHAFVSDWARFYGLTLLLSVAALLFFLRYVERGGGSHRFLASVILCRLCHEFGIALAALPLFAVAVVPP